MSTLRTFTRNTIGEFHYHSVQHAPSMNNCHPIMRREAAAARCSCSPLCAQDWPLRRKGERSCISVGRYPRLSGKILSNSTSNTMQCFAEPKVGVVIVDHGSKKSAANDMLDGVVDVYKHLLTEVDSTQVDGRVVCVTKAHMEIARPSILDSVRMCVEEYGVDKVVVAPYFLSRGRHIQEDIPRLVQEAEECIVQESGRSVRCIVAEPLGVDVGVIQVMKKRVEEALIVQSESVA